MCASSLGKWTSLFMLYFVLLGQHRGVKQDAGFMLLLCVADKTDAAGGV